MALSADLAAHLQSGATTLCRAWAVTRADGESFGFTDHDCAFEFEGISFRADTGLAASAIQQATGLSVDNTEAVGVLSDAALSEADILTGRFDGAEVRAWLVNWRDVDQRLLQFRGSMGEIKRSKGAFQAELRGLTDALNQPSGRVFQSPCSAVLGDSACRVDLDAPGLFFEGSVEVVEGGKVFRFFGLDGFDERRFEGGRLHLQSGAAAGVFGVVKSDRLSGSQRVIKLCQGLGAEVVPGDLVRLEAGCDKRVGTCAAKFGNILNFQGFPHVPGEDWMMRYPSDGQPMDGGSLFR